MIKLRIYTDGNDYVEYEDILDLSIDAKSCSGVGFMSQEARQAEFDLVMDSWLNEHVINGADVGLSYLGMYAAIYRDSEIIFSGFMKRDVDITRPEGCESVKLIRVRIYDLLWVLLDFAEGKEYNLYEFDPFSPVNGLVIWMGWVIQSMPWALRSRIGLGNEYEALNWAPYFSAGDPIFNWLDDMRLQPEYPDVRRRSLVMYESDGDLYVEYCLHDTFTFIVGVGGYFTATHYQHFIWRKYRLVIADNGWECGLVMVDGQYVALTRDDSATLESDDDITVAAWVATLPSYFDTYNVAEENDITEYRIGGLGFVIANGTFYQTYHPNDEVFPIGSDEEDDREAVPVDAVTFIEDMTKILCAWIEAVPGALKIKNRMVLPAESGYSLSDDEVINFKRERAEKGTLSMDCGYLANGDSLRTGVEKYYNEVFMERMPYGYEVGVVLAEHRYGVGDVIDYDGWLIMITEVSEDIHGREALLRGVGGRLE